MQSLIKKGNRLTNMAIACLIMVILSFVLLFIPFGIFIGLVLIIISFIVTIILDLVICITILATDWKNPQLNNEKTLWGILGFFLIGFISGFVFGSKVKNVLSNPANTVEPTATSTIPPVTETPII